LAADGETCAARNRSEVRKITNGAPIRWDPGSSDSENIRDGTWPGSDSNSSISHNSGFKTSDTSSDTVASVRSDSIETGRNFSVITVGCDAKGMCLSDYTDFTVEFRRLFGTGSRNSESSEGSHCSDKCDEMWS